MNFKYDNITISGGVAVGKNTLFDNLRSYLEPYGWRFRTTGQIIRDYTKENVLPLATLVTEEFDRKIEAKTRALLELEKNWVIEAWLSGFIARDLPSVLKVLLICSHHELQVDRVANRDKISIAEAKKFIKLREEGNFKKWQSQYGDYDFFNPDYYNLVIDTYSSGQIESVGIVLDKLGYDL